MSSIKEIFGAKVQMDRGILTRIILFLGLSLMMIANSMFFDLPSIGILVSVPLLYIISEAVGDRFFPKETPVLRKILGFATFVLLMALAGSGFILVAKFTELWSLVLVVGLGLIFYLPYIFRRKSPSHKNIPENVEKDKASKFNAKAYSLVCVFLALVGISFYALLMARTGEGRTSVWLTIPNFFLPTFLLAALFLLFALFMTRINVGVKVALVAVFSFLVHSLFLIVWYPGRYGDPWVHLGEERVIYMTGAPYAYERLLARHSFLDLVTSKAQYALVVFFTRMFSVDIYWVHVVFMPFFWSLFTVLFSYKITEMLTPRRNTTIPLLAAVSTLLFPSLVIWGTVSVPNSLGFIFFLFTILLLLYWMNNGGKSLLVMALIATFAAGLAHPQTGIFTAFFFVSAIAFQRFARRSLKVIIFIGLFALYPLALYLFGATFSFDGLLVLDNFLAFQSAIVTLPFVFGALGLVSFLWLKGAKGKNPLVLFVFYVAVLAEYYFTTYGMRNLPFGSGRILVMSDLLLVPFVAFGIFAIFDLLRKILLHVKISPFGKKFSINPGGHFIALLLISLFLSSQVTFVLYQTYPHKEIEDVQPAAYEVEAIRYIDSTAPGRYVVLADTQFAGLASGILGADYSYGANPKGIVGIPEFEFRTYQSFAAMVANPSIRVLQKAMAFDRASVAYVVVSVRDYDYLNVVRRMSESLPVDKIFGDGKLYVFKYPIPIIEESGPSVMVTFEDQSSSQVETRLTYMFRSEANFTLTLSGHSSYNITDYPLYWTFNELTVNNGTKAARFDDSSDLNSFVYVKDLLPSDTLTVIWQANLNYPQAVWKDDSFKIGWRTHPLYPGLISPQIVTDGNVLSMTWNFEPGQYQYYYYVKDCNVVSDGNESIIVRWKATGPVAVVAIYVDSNGQVVVPYGSQSDDWSRTIFPLPVGTITSVMVGITNIANTKISGVMTLSIDYILVSAGSSG